jgi:hypothetical protein
MTVTMQYAVNRRARDVVNALRSGLRVRWLMALMALLACALAAPFGYAQNACPTGLQVQLVKQQLLPASPYRYTPCGFPAASVASARVAVADDDGVVGPSSCMSKVCVFDARSGAREHEWDLISASAGSDLSERLAPLSDKLGKDEFKPMMQIELSKHQITNQRDKDTLRLTMRASRGEMVVTAYGGGYDKSTHHFKAITLKCEGKIRKSRAPQEVRAWTLNGMAAVALAAQYYGDQPGCSWTQWAVMPIRPVDEKKRN